MFHVGRYYGVQRVCLFEKKNHLSVPVARAWSFSSRLHGIKIEFHED